VAAKPGEVLFTSGATEALHQGICGLVGPGDEVIVSSVEHPAVFGACRQAGVSVVKVPVDAQGRLAPQDVVSAVTPRTRLVVITAAQNELGNVYPVAEIATLVSPVPVLCDAVQAFGKIHLDVQALGVSMVALSGHKIGAPAGVGALWISEGTRLNPLFEGGGQERTRRGGTENIAGIIGFGVAARYAAERVQRFVEVRSLRDRMESELLRRVPGIVIQGDVEHRLPNTLSFRVSGIEGDVLVQSLDIEGIEISAGAACSAGTIEASEVLLALGLEAAVAREGLRVSWGRKLPNRRFSVSWTSLPRWSVECESSMEGGCS
jgi:cysteine desulfurase